MKKQTQPTSAPNKPAQICTAASASLFGRLLLINFECRYPAVPPFARIGVRLLPTRKGWPPDKRLILAFGAIGYSPASSLTTG
jgi:hypothetical protein